MQAKYVAEVQHRDCKIATQKQNCLRQICGNGPAGLTTSCTSRTQCWGRLLGSIIASKVKCVPVTEFRNLLEWHNEWAATRFRLLYNTKSPPIPLLLSSDPFEPGERRRRERTFTRSQPANRRMRRAPHSRRPESSHIIHENIAFMDLNSLLTLLFGLSAVVGTAATIVLAYKYRLRQRKAICFHIIVFC